MPFKLSVEYVFEYLFRAVIRDIVNFTKNDQSTFIFYRLKKRLRSMVNLHQHLYRLKLNQHQQNPVQRKHR